MSDLETERIAEYLKNKYKRSGIKLPKEVTAYGKDNPKGWLILAMNWKRSLLDKYSGIAKDENAVNDLIKDAMIKGLQELL